ncbi:hypothetical protein ACVWZK_003762 [Bradyrhizobium sp. GM0.4]
MRYRKAIRSQLLTNSNTPKPHPPRHGGGTSWWIWRDMALLDDVIDASGGMARWNSLSRFTLHLSVAGTLFSSTGHASEFKDVTAEGSTRTQSVRFTGITGGEHSGSFQPDAITIESLEGEILRTWRNPSLAFTEAGSPALAGELHLVFFCGVAIWNYLTNPFLLAHPDVLVEELPPWQENNESWTAAAGAIPTEPDHARARTDLLFRRERIATADRSRSVRNESRALLLGP